MTDIPRILGSRYEIGDLIGRGGMAQVHLGYDTRLSRTVAIKILRTDLAADPLFLARFRREAQSAAALNHPSIVAVYDTGESPVTTATGHEISLPYIVMEYVKGRTVASLLTTGEPVPIAEAVQVVTGVLSALEYSHHEGIIHRDIKPGNVMLTPDGKVKVMDFGIARAIADSAATMTQTNSVVGTAQYLSPEQARGEVVDARSDLYSTGCLLYELLTGKPPFTGDSAVAVAYQHVSEAPKPASEMFPDIPDTIDRVVMKSLAKNRDERYQNAAEFRSDLLSAARGEGVNAPAVTAAMKTVPMPVNPPTPATQATTALPRTSTSAPVISSGQTGVQPAVGSGGTNNSRRNRQMMWIAGVLLAMAAVIGLYALFSGDSPDPKPTNTASADSTDKVTVPKLTGMTEKQAKKALEEEGLVFVKGSDQASDTVKAGQFVSSSPSPGSTVSKGEKITVHFSSGNSEITVPDVTGISLDQAKRKLDRAGLKVGKITNSSGNSATSGTVVSTSPEAGESVEEGSSVDIKVSGGGDSDIPNVSNLSAEEAQKKLENAGYKVNVTYVPVYSEAEDGKVIGRKTDGAGNVTLQVGKYTTNIQQPTESPTHNNPTTPAPTQSPTHNNPTTLPPTDVPTVAPPTTGG